MIDYFSPVTIIPIIITAIPIQRNRFTFSLRNTSENTVIIKYCRLSSGKAWLKSAKESIISHITTQDEFNIRAAQILTFVKQYFRKCQIPRKDNNFISSIVRIPRLMNIWPVARIVSCNRIRINSFTILH